MVSFHLFLSKECSTSFTHVRAHMVGGIWVGTLAMFLTHVYLLELMAVIILLANTMITFIVLYRPHRSAYDSLCAVTVNHASKACIYPSRFKQVPNNSKQDPMSDNINRFQKSRLSLAKYMSKKTNVTIGCEEEIEVPLLSSLQFTDESGMDDQTHATSEDDHQIEAKEADEVNTKEKFYSRVRLKEITSIGGSRLSPLNFNSKNGTIINAAEVNTSAMANVSDYDSSDEDIDTIVAEYKEKLRVATSGNKISTAPTAVTARKALFLTVGISVTTFCISLYSLIESENEDLFSSAFSNVLITVMCIINLIMLLRLWLLPTLRRSNISFTIPFSPFVPFVTLVLNTLLFTELLTRTFWTVIPLNTVGILWYIFYVSKNSVASKDSKEKDSSSTETRPIEFIRLLPLIPATIRTSRPQNNQTTEANRNRLIL